MAVELSVIVPCYGHAAELISCLQALMSQQTRINYEVIIVDSSSDPRIETVNTQFPDVRLIRSQRRLFPGGARNLGVRNAASDRLAFIDADCIPNPQWVELAYQSFENGYALTSGPVLDVTPIHPIAWVDNRCQFSDFQRGHPAQKIKHAPSSNLICPKHVWETADGFREDLLTGEDGMLTVNEHVQGKGIWFDPALIVWHHGRKTLHGFIKHQQTLGYHRGYLGLFVSKSLEIIGRHPLLAWTIVPRRTIYFGLRTLQYDIAGFPRFILSLPLFFIGLTAWAIAFHKGITQRTKEQQ